MYCIKALIIMFMLHAQTNTPRKPNFLQNQNQIYYQAAVAHSYSFEEFALVSSTKYRHGE